MLFFEWIFFLKSISDITFIEYLSNLPNIKILLSSWILK